MYLYSSKRGFTLIEMLLYMAILSIVMGGFVIFAITVFQTRIKAEAVSVVETQGNMAMEQILKSIRLGTVINTPAAGVSASSASINVFDGVKSPTLFDLNSGAIRIKEGASAYVNLTPANVTVSNLSFQNLTQTGAPGVIRVSYTLTSINSSGRSEYSYSKNFVATASLRL